MIDVNKDVKAAVGAATKFVEAIYGPHEQISLTLEEIEPTDDNNFWLITFSFSKPSVTSALDSFTRRRPAHRDYKVFKIDRASGEVVSMKMRSDPGSE